MISHITRFFFRCHLSIGAKITNFDKTISCRQSLVHLGCRCHYIKSNFCYMSGRCVFPIDVFDSIPLFCLLLWFPNHRSGGSPGAFWQGIRGGLTDCLGGWTLYIKHWMVAYSRLMYMLLLLRLVERWKHTENLYFTSFMKDFDNGFLGPYLQIETLSSDEWSPILHFWTVLLSLKPSLNQ